MKGLKELLESLGSINNEKIQRVQLLATITGLFQNEDKMSYDEFKKMLMQGVLRAASTCQVNDYCEVSTLLAMAKSSTAASIDLPSEVIENLEKQLAKILEKSGLEEKEEEEDDDDDDDVTHVDEVIFKGPVGEA